MTKELKVNIEFNDVDILRYEDDYRYLGHVNESVVRPPEKEKKYFFKIQFTKDQNNKIVIKQQLRLKEQFGDNVFSGETNDFNSFIEGIFEHREAFYYTYITKFIAELESNKKLEQLKESKDQISYIQEIKENMLNATVKFLESKKTKLDDRENHTLYYAKQKLNPNNEKSNSTTKEDLTLFENAVKKTMAESSIYLQDLKQEHIKTILDICAKGGQKNGIKACKPAFRAAAKFFLDTYMKNPEDTKKLDGWTENIITKNEPRKAKAEVALLGLVCLLGLGVAASGKLKNVQALKFMKPILEFVSSHAWQAGLALSVVGACLTFLAYKDISKIRHKSDKQVKIMVDSFAKEHGNNLSV